MELEPNTRLFLVVGKNAEADMLTEAFRRFGTIQSVKMVKEKGVAYIKYEKASSAAAAIENMHEAVLNDGRGPMVKVMFAEAPKSNSGRKNGPSKSEFGDSRGPPDPDNVPPLSRLFIVVPKTADGAAIEADMAAFNDLQYCKTDLIASKGIVFCKYSKSSSALRALETVQETNMLSGYKVKCMLAEPKGKRSRNEGSGNSDPASPVFQAALAYERAGLPGSTYPSSSLSTGSFLSNAAYPQSPSHSALSGGSEARAPSLNSSWVPSCARRAHEMSSVRLPPGSNSISAALASNGGLPASGYSGAEIANVGGALGIDGISPLAGLQAVAAIQGAANLASTGSISGLDLLAIGKQVGLGGLGGLGSINPAALGSLNRVQMHADRLSAPSTPAAGAMTPTRERSPLESVIPQKNLNVLVHTALTEEQLTAIFSVFPDLECCQLKRDQNTGHSKGVACVSYSHADSAARAIESLDGMEVPPGSGHYMKVMFAEPNREPRKLRSCAHLSSVVNDSSDTIHQRQNEDDDAPESKQRLGSQDSTSDSLDHRVEVAAVQNSLSHLSMPQPTEEPRGPEQSLLQPRQQLALSSSESDKECEAESQAKIIALSSPEAQSRTVYTILALPLPTYALEHTFSRCGAVERVRLQPENQRFGLVQFCKAESARVALEQLNGTDICGLALNVLPADPLLAVRNKRARVAV